MHENLLTLCCCSVMLECSFRQLLTDCTAGTTARRCQVCVDTMRGASGQDHKEKRNQVGPELLPGAAIPMRKRVVHNFMIISRRVSTQPVVQHQPMEGRACVQQLL